MPSHGLDQRHAVSLDLSARARARANLWRLCLHRQDPSQLVSYHGMGRRKPHTDNESARTAEAHLCDPLTLAPRPPLPQASAMYWYLTACVPNAPADELVILQGTVLTSV